MPDDRYDWVPLTVASRRLGRSPETIRRQIREGTFEHPHERVPLARGSNRDRFVVGFPKGQDDAPQPVMAPYDATSALDAYERGMAAQRAQDATRRQEDAVRIVRQARRIGRLLRDVASLDATAQLLAQQLVEAEAELEARRAADRPPWWRRVFG